jgi:hypothetical protein
MLEIQMSCVDQNPLSWANHSGLPGFSRNWIALDGDATQVGDGTGARLGERATMWQNDVGGHQVDVDVHQVVSVDDVLRKEKITNKSTALHNSDGFIDRSWRKSVPEVLGLLPRGTA